MASTMPPDILAEQNHLVCPEKHATWWSWLWFSWISPIMEKGSKRQLTIESLWELNEENRTENLESTFEKHLNMRLVDFERSNSRMKGDPEDHQFSTIGFGGIVGKAVFATFWRTFTLGAACLLVATLFNSLGPVLLKQLLRVLREDVSQKDIDEDADTEITENRLGRGALLAISLLVTQLAHVFSSQMHYHLLYSLAMRVQAVVISAFYRKSLRLSSAARQQRSAGEMVNIASSDARCLMVVMRSVPLIWSVLLQIFLAFALIRAEAGTAAAFAGLVAMGMLVPLSSWLTSLQRRIQASQMITKDYRLKVMSEILAGIKILKLYGWEFGFKNVVSDIRERELAKLSKLAIIESLLTLVWFIAPFVVSLITFAAYAFVQPSAGSLGFEQTLMCLALIQQLRAPLQQLPQVLSSLGQVSVSIRRLDNFFAGEEVENYVTSEYDRHCAIRIENALFYWGASLSPKNDIASQLKPMDKRTRTERSNEEETNVVTLGPFNLEIPHGQLLAIVGRVAQGKSSFLAAILGELQKLSGRVNVSGRVAFVPQAAWLHSGTLRDNILFGQPYDEQRYQDVLRRCALVDDLKALPAGDMTQLGDTGVSLSGGQKQLISLARAVYLGAEIYFLDDPFSALDTNVAWHVFDEVISDRGVLKDSTRVLVTHAVQFLPHAHRIAVIDGGKIVQDGPSTDLIIDSKARFRTLLIRIKEQSERTRASRSLQGDSLLKRKTGPSELGLDKETIEDGPDADVGILSQIVASPIAVPPMSPDGMGLKRRYILHEYLWHAGYRSCAGAVCSLVASAAFEMASSFWIADWSSHDNGDKIRSRWNWWNWRLVGYTFLGVSQGIFLVLGTASISNSGLRASRSFHDRVIHQVLRAPFFFFDVTSLGRILSRFSGDLEDVELSLAHSIREWLQSFLELAIFFAVICTSVPVFAILAFPVAYAYYNLQRAYLPTSSRLRSMELTTRTPILSHISETIQGVPVIRAFGIQDMFIAQTNFLVNENNRSYYLYLCANRWLGVRLEGLTAFVLFCTAMLILASENLISPSAAGLCLTHALRLADAFGVLIRVTASVTVISLSLHHLIQYLHLPSEAKTEDEEGLVVPNDWPTRGEIEFCGYSGRYRPYLPLVVKNVSFRVDAGLRVGVVGRTGAGKSSLAMALLRALEAVEGRITIDEIDISRLGLHTLRTKLSIIPQEPVLFSGSLRLNLDPFKRHSNEELWNALEKSNLEDFVLKSPLGLDMAISEGGGNLSVGQRQLVCLTRALLRQSKVLILDEATAAVDEETDRCIQQTIRDEFSESTILAIAHRVPTVIDYDRILVLENGEVREFEEPSKLLEDSTSLFYAIWNEDRNK